MNAVTDLPAEPALDDLELELLLEALYQRFGFDYRSHERLGLRRKLLDLLRAGALPNRGHIFN